MAARLEELVAAPSLSDGIGGVVSRSHFDSATLSSRCVRNLGGSPMVAPAYE